MAGPWERYQANPEVSASSPKPWERFSAPAQAQPAQAYTGSVLPLSRDAQGNVSFDSNAGILGSLKRAFTTPGDVYAGRLDPNSDEARRGVLDLAGLTGASPAAGIARKVAVKPPTAEELHAAAKVGYDAARDSGVIYRSGAVADVANASKQALETDGVLARLAPKTHSILDDLSNPPADSFASISGVEAARRALNEAGRDFTNPTERLAADRARVRLDQFIESPAEGSVVSGPAAQAAQILKDARGNYAAGARSDQLTGVERAADLRSSAANSGQNYDNSARSRIASLLLNKKASSGYTPDEVAQLEQIVRGTPASNIARGVSSLLGGGGGMAGAVTGFGGAAAGYMSGSPALAVAGAALPLAGNAARRVANVLNERAFAAADEATRMRSPLHNERVAASPTEMAVLESRAALVRALIEQQTGKERR